MVLALSRDDNASEVPITPRDKLLPSEVGSSRRGSNGFVEQMPQNSSLRRARRETRLRDTGDRSLVHRATRVRARMPSKCVVRLNKGLRLHAGSFTVCWTGEKFDSAST